jgi:hypothetical protein
LDRIYPPLAAVPTWVHRALLELMMAAAVGRRAALSDDHLPSFLAMGSTLRWKTALGRFACHLLGVDPSSHLIDLASESGRSVFVRRTQQGHLGSQRHVLTSPLVVMDDILQAEPRGRAALWPFLSGRRQIPYDHGHITIACVTLLTLNPRRASTLEAQTTFHPALLRRLLIGNLDAVSMPDVALSGHRALQEAADHGPLDLPGPRYDLATHRPAVVAAVRALVRPEHHERVDTEMLLTLSAGMTAFIDDDERAIQQVLYDAGVLFDSLGWTVPEWQTGVSQFALPCATPGPPGAGRAPDEDAPLTSLHHHRPNPFMEAPDDGVTSHPPALYGPSRDL